MPKMAEDQEHNRRTDDRELEGRKTRDVLVQASRTLDVLEDLAEEYRVIMKRLREAYGVEPGRG